MYPRQIFMAAISAGALVISAGYAFAAPIAPDLEIIDEDKRFFNFTCSVVSNGNTSGGCETVNVTALTGDTGLRFQDFFVSFSGPVNSALDVLITYDVQVLDPTQSIESISLGKRLMVIAWFVLSIFIDYGLGYHPPMTAYVSAQYAGWLAVILTSLLSVGLLFWPYHQQVSHPSGAKVRAADA